MAASMDTLESSSVCETFVELRNNTIIMMLKSTCACGIVHEHYNTAVNFVTVVRLMCQKSSVVEPYNAARE